MKQDILTKTKEEILEIAKKARPNCKRVEIGRKTYYIEHCKMPMQRVKVFSTGHDCSIHYGEQRETDHIVCRCRECSYHAFIDNEGFLVSPYPNLD